LSTLEAESPIPVAGVGTSGKNKRSSRREASLAKSDGNAPKPSCEASRYRLADGGFYFGQHFSSENLFSCLWLRTWDRSRASSGLHILSAIASLSLVRRFHTDSRRFFDHFGFWAFHSWKVRESRRLLSNLTRNNPSDVFRTHSIVSTSRVFHLLPRSFVYVMWSALSGAFSVA
jgi:hypothetical protein